MSKRDAKIVLDYKGHTAYSWGRIAESWEKTADDLKAENDRLRRLLVNTFHEGVCFLSKNCDVRRQLEAEYAELIG